MKTLSATIAVTFFALTVALFSFGCAQDKMMDPMQKTDTMHNDSMQAAPMMKTDTMKTEKMGDMKTDDMGKMDKSMQ